MIKVSIIGATGYTGSELMRLLVHHPEVSLVHLTARQFAGTKITHIFPFLTGHLGDQTFIELDVAQIKQDSDLVFICLPHGHSMNLIQALGNDVKVIDMGADFRIKNTASYEAYYGVSQTAPELLSKAVYGLSEYNREAIKQATLIANPGCFVTNALLALSPAVKESLLEPKSIIIDSKTGVSGAGRSANVANLLSELGNSFKAYNPFGHRHIPEIEQELNQLSDELVQIQFTPHLLPTERGIFSTIYANVKPGVTASDIRNIYFNHYQNEPFVHLLDEGQLPNLKDVRGTNHCQLQVQLDERTGRLVILSIIDNLGKGASGQAVQNLNLMFGFAETTGLTQVALVP